MPAGWDFGGAFGQGFEIGDRMAQRARQRRMDEVAAQERDRVSAQRAEDVGARERTEMRLGEAQRAEIEDRMARRAREAAGQPSEIALRRAQEFRLMNPIEKPVAENQARAAMIKDNRTSLEDLQARSEGSDWYNPASWFGGRGLSDEELAAQNENIANLRALTTPKSRLAPTSDRMAAPQSPASSKPTPAQAAAYKQAIAQGKSPAEAARIADGVE